MKIGNYVRAAGRGFALASAVFFGFCLGQYYEGNARCVKDGIEEHFAFDFPGLDPDVDNSDDPKQERLYELREVYISGELQDYSEYPTPAEHLSPAEQADAILKGRTAKREVESSCQEYNQSY